MLTVSKFEVYVAIATGLLLGGRMVYWALVRPEHYVTNWSPLGFAVLVGLFAVLYLVVWCLAKLTLYVSAHIKFVD